MNMVYFGQFHSLYVTVWQQIPEHLFQNQGSESWNCSKFNFFIKKKCRGRIFFLKWRNSKSGKKTLFRFCWLIIFCSSEEPPATSAWMQLRFITSFKLLHRKAILQSKCSGSDAKTSPYVIVIKKFLNPEGHPNPISGSKVTASLLKGCILPIGGASAGEGLLLKPAQQACFLLI